MRIRSSGPALEEPPGKRYRHFEQPPLAAAMSRLKTYEGGCLCGSIRFQATGPALKPHTCSCKLCQRHSGALTMMWVEFPRDSVRWTGAGGAPRTWRSSAWSNRAFCPACGSTIGAIDDKPVVALAVGSFDANNRKELAPVSHACAGKLPTWWHLPGS
jgi:hypothetical protein